ncbi:MAG: chondroitinase-B domain-containing protein [Chitinophagaceae bacterium]
MLRLLLINCYLLFTLFATANTIPVKNANDLSQANKQAKPGDIIVLQNGDWNDISFSLTCSGTAENPIIFKAETSGKLRITGNSKLKLGGQYIIVDGWYFINGYSGSSAIIDFRLNKSTVANHCRITNCKIESFNNPKRLDENYWVSFSGKHNRIDHCTFLNKLNLGVLMAVTLEDDESRENFHSIDHNYFGVRLPLASNSGEIIRIGVSQHCQFNSNTQVTDNFFEHCDGETEVVSVKSGSNVVRNNLFKECQGGVVLRHGNDNTVENNIFLGNGKEGTGGVRIINKGQWVVNNLFYKCRGVDFRSPLSIMNGVPNSPANRYVPVTDAVVSNNTFYDCAPISLCEGSDTERSVAPNHVLFERNVFYNSKKNLVYKSFDDIGGIHFAGNLTTQNTTQNLAAGFAKVLLVPRKSGSAAIILTPTSAVLKVSDSLSSAGQARISQAIRSVPGFTDEKKIAMIEANAHKNCGASWLSGIQPAMIPKKANCKNAGDVLQAIEKNKAKNMVVHLSGSDYHFETPVVITANTTITSPVGKKISFAADFPARFLFEITGGASLTLIGLDLDLSGLAQDVFITTDPSGSSAHSSFVMNKCNIKNLKGGFFEAAKSSVCDSVVVHQNSFTNTKGILFNFGNENDKKGYYNVEQLTVTGNAVVNHKEQILSMLRGGNDESTMGPLLIFRNNSISNAKSDQPLIYLYGVQKSFIEKNSFTNCNPDKGPLLEYMDAVRAAHVLRNNTITTSGPVLTNKFVTQ